jgi:hypothetical protein
VQVPGLESVLIQVVTSAQSQNRLALPIGLKVKAVHFQ